MSRTHALKLNPLKTGVRSDLADAATAPGTKQEPAPQNLAAGHAAVHRAVKDGRFDSIVAVAYCTFPEATFDCGVLYDL